MQTMRGRVLGLIFRGGPALGALVVGVASQLFGLQASLAVGCAISLVTAAPIWRHLASAAQNLGEQIP
jgi:hypothetical protein